MNYTKGEWRVTGECFHDNIGAYRLVLGANDELIGHLWPNSNPQTEANAQLIAAAPDMYEALKVVVGYFDSPEVSNASDFIPQLRNALAKAEAK